MDQRSPAIDYLRAFAILWVVWYHFCSISIFKTGYYGVMLFFIISGYCIAQSAESSRGAWHFYSKRLGRLMPALVVCSIITVSIKHLAPDLIDASRLVPWRDMIIGWFLIPIFNLPRVDFLLPDGAYWSLIVEFRFYALIFVLMLVGLRRLLLPAVCVFTVVQILRGGSVNDIDFYPFFIAGLAVAELSAGRGRACASGLAAAFALDLFFLLTQHDQPSAPPELSRSVVLWVGTGALILATQTKVPPVMAKLLRPVAYVGLVSYPLYLIHQDAGKIVLRYFGFEYSDMMTPRMIALILVPIVLTILAGAIHELVERRSIKPLTALLSAGWLRSRLLAAPVVQA